MPFLTPNSVLALLKCGVEQCPLTTLFCSLFGLGDHFPAAVALGLIEPAPTGDYLDPRPTPQGQAFYDQFRLADFPPGRAASWGSNALVTAAVVEIETRRATLRGTP